MAILKDPKSKLVVFLYFIIVIPLFSQINYPVDLPKFKITKSYGCDTSSIFLAPTASKAPYLMIIDNEGNPKYFKKVKSSIYDFKPHPNGTLSYFDRGGDCFYIMNSNYELIDSVKCLGELYTDFHELRILPNGNYLILGFDSQIVDMSRIVEGGRDSATVIGYYIQEIDKNKNLIFEWKTWDHIDIKDSYTDLKQGTIDITHGNSIDVDYDGNLLVSLRNTQEIIKIERKTGAVIWRLGGRKNQFTFIKDPLWFSWQHAARRLPNGNLLLFDNGFRREPQSVSYSRALEYELDEINKTAKLVWEYRNSPDVFSIGLGYSQRLPNGNTFIGWGAAVPAITEVTSQGREVFELSFEKDYSTYRAYRYPWGSPKITNFSPISYSIEKTFFVTTNQSDTISSKITLSNKNSFPITISSIRNNSRSFIISSDLPEVINPNDSISIRFCFRSDLSLSPYVDTIRIYSNCNDISIAVEGLDMSNVKGEVEEINNSFSIKQNYPNPFNGETKINFTLKRASLVKILIYDLLGRFIAEIINKEYNIGNYTINFNGRNNNGEVIPSGVYIYTLQVGNFRVSKKMTLLK
ncbi:MAG: aryl-sulfate sulfotransferase [Melioribacteraceae bacterium]